MKKKASRTVTLLLAGFMSGCADYDPVSEPVQRDVYTKLDDCLADWNDKALCLEAAKLAEAEKQKLAGNGSGGSMIVHPYYFYGPEYVPGSRVTYYNGAQIVPRGNVAAMQTAKVAPSSAFSSSRSSVAGSVSRGGGVTGGGSAARGGFGATGRAATGGSMGA
jgi:hypothetical protein